MSLIASLNIFVGANTKQATNRLKELQKWTNASAWSMVKLGTAISAGLAAGAAATAVYTLTNLTSAAMENADRLGDLADNLGVTVAGLSRLEYAAKLSGVEAETLAGSLTKMNVNLADAASTGKGSAAEALKRLGLTAEALTGLLPNEALKVIAERMSKIPNPAERAALAMDIFGKSGTGMVAFLSKGSEGIAELEAKADELGVTLSDIDAQRLNELNDKFDELGAYMTGVGQVIAAKLAPYVTRLIDDFLAATANGAALGVVVTASFNAIASVIGYLMDSVQVVINMFISLSAVVVAIAEGIVGLLGFAAHIFSTEWGNALHSVTDQLHDLQVELFRYQEAAWGAQPASVAFTDYLANVQLNLSSLNKELEATPDRIEKVSEEFANVKKAGADLLADLQHQLDTINLSGNPLKIWEAAQKGVGQDVLNQAWDIDAEIKEIQAFQKAREDLAAAQKKQAEAAARIMEESMSKEDKYAQKLMEILELERLGYLGAEESALARKRLKEELDSSTNKMSASTAFGAKELGSAAASTAVANFYNQSNGKSAMTDVAENTRTMVDENKKQTEYLKTIASRESEEVIDFSLA